MPVLRTPPDEQKRIDLQDRREEEQIVKSLSELDTNQLLSLSKKVLIDNVKRRHLWGLNTKGKPHAASKYTKASLASILENYLEEFKNNDTLDNTLYLEPLEEVIESDSYTSADERASQIAQDEFLAMKLQNDLEVGDKERKVTFGKNIPNLTAEQYQQNIQSTSKASGSKINDLGVGQRQSNSKFNNVAHVAQGVDNNRILPGRYRDRINLNGEHNNNGVLAIGNERGLQYEQFGTGIPRPQASSTGAVPNGNGVDLNNLNNNLQANFTGNPQVTFSHNDLRNRNNMIPNNVTNNLIEGMPNYNTGIFSGFRRGPNMNNDFGNGHNLNATPRGNNFREDFNNAANFYNNPQEQFVDHRYNEMRLQNEQMNARIESLTNAINNINRPMPQNNIERSTTVGATGRDLDNEFDNMDELAENLKKVSCLTSKRCQAIHVWTKYAAICGKPVDNMKDINIFTDWLVVRCIAKFTVNAGKKEDVERVKSLQYAISKVPQLSDVADKPSLLKDLVKIIDVCYHDGSKITNANIDSLALEFKMSNNYTQGSKGLGSYSYRSSSSGQNSSNNNSHKGVCNNYNKKEGCSRQICNFLHACRKCLSEGRGQKPHSAAKCPFAGTGTSSSQ